MSQDPYIGNNGASLQYIQGWALLVLNGVIITPINGLKKKAYLVL